MPLYRRLPKRGFNPLNKEKIAIMNLNKIQSLLESKRVNANEQIDINSLKKANILGKTYKKIKILGTGEIKSKINITADFISKAAKEKLEKVGGVINLTKKN